MDNTSRSDSFGQRSENEVRGNSSGFRFDESHATTRDQKTGLMNSHSSAQMPRAGEVGSQERMVLSPLDLQKDKLREVMLRAVELFDRRVDWLTFFREVLGVHGVARTLFGTQPEFLAFEQTDEFAQVERMMQTLRAEKLNPKPNREPTKVITVRLPESVHQALRAEASDHATSINKLCISKLLQALKEEAAGDLEAMVKAENVTSGSAENSPAVSESSHDPQSVREAESSQSFERLEREGRPESGLTPYGQSGSQNSSF